MKGRVSDCGDATPQKSTVPRRYPSTGSPGCRHRSRQFRRTRDTIVYSVVIINFHF